VRHDFSLALALATGLLLASNEALATEYTPSDPASADVLFRDGRALVVAGDYAAACPKFAESLRFDHAPGTLLNLADCEEHTGRIATAWAHFRELALELPDADERQALATHRAAALEPRLPHLTVASWASLPPSAKVFRDDVELGRASLDTALPVDPGTHLVLVTEGDHTLSRVQIEIVEKESRVLTPDSFEKGETHGGAKRTAAWVTGGLAVGALVTGASFGLLAVANNNAAHCANGSCGDSAEAHQYDTARTQARVADVALGIGIVATVAAGYLFLTSRKSDAQAPPALALLSAGLGGVTW
jgi:tetratricopeptide (TPR) repeat protein